MAPANSYWLSLLLLMQPGSVQPLKTERLELVEMPNAGEGEHRYVVLPPDRLRQRHFRIQVDRSVCKGKLIVNSQELNGEDAAEVFRFDRSNEISIAGCLERTPQPIQVLAYPKVFISSVKVNIQKDKSLVVLDVTVRNTLPNSTSCLLRMAEAEKEIFVGPEVSQTLQLFLRLKGVRPKSLSIELYKYAEAIEGTYTHVETVDLAGREP